MDLMETCVFSLYATLVPITSIYRNISQKSSVYHHITPYYIQIQVTNVISETLLLVYYQLTNKMFNWCQSAHLHQVGLCRPFFQ